MIPTDKPSNDRSPKWPAAREDWLKTHGTCAACGRTNHLEVHHKRPFHLDPTLELDPVNFITLCEHPSAPCHLVFGHLLSWEAFNPSVESDSALYLAKVKARPTTL